MVIDGGISIYMGIPGSGKTTFASYIVKHCIKKNINVWSNVEIKGAMKLTVDDLMSVDVSNGVVIWDEAGIDFDARAWKSFKSSWIEFFKMHRHYKLSIIVLSQFWDDVDKKIRLLSNRIYLVNKSLIPFLITRKSIITRIGIDETTKQIVQQYEFGTPIISTKWVYVRPLWKMFNSFSRKELPRKDWIIW